MFVGVKNRAGAYSIPNEHCLSKVDSLNPSDSIYYEENNLVTVFNVDTLRKGIVKSEQIRLPDYMVGPKFPGGQKNLLSWLSNNINYPLEAYKAGIEGIVVVQFVIKNDGSVGDVTVVISVDPLLDNEAVRVIKAMPKWIPGKQYGKPVNVRLTLPITFKI